MDRPLLSIAGRLYPGLLESEGRERAIGLADVLGVAYAGPLAVVSLVWLVAATDVSVLGDAWVPLAVFLPLMYAFRRLDFTTYVEIEPGVFGSFGGSFEDVLRWPAALLFGPIALWLHVIWRTVGLIIDLGRSDLTALRWSAVRNFLIDIGGDALAGLVGLALYVRIGGVYPPQALSFAALEPAVYATVVRFLIPIAVSTPHLVYLGRSSGMAFPPKSRRALSRFTVLSSSWPLLVAPFTVFSAGLYAEKGLVAFLFVVGAALLAAALAHKMSRAVERGARRTRELESLERLSRAIANSPPDDVRLEELLEEHAGTMFAMSTIDIRLFPDRLLLHQPDFVELPDEVTWDWIQATGETFVSPAGRELPWGGVPRSYGLVLAPILDPVSGAVLGGIVLRKRIDPEEVLDILPAAQSLAAQIAAALHGAEVYTQTLEHMRTEEELAVAADMQASLMPTRAPDIPGWEFKALIDSAREASGDFVDLIPLSGGKWGILVADVSGKGVAAALYMAVVRTLVRTYAVDHEDDPAFVMSAVNRRILSDTTEAESFVTMFYAVLEPTTGRLVYSNAGHNAPFLIRAGGDGGADELRATGIPLGMLRDAAWESAEASVEAGDRLLAYTDGVTEAQNASDEMFGESRLLEVAKSHASETPIEMRTAVFDEVREFVGDAPQNDDITLMVVARMPP
jgi:serine phosphatase RsbU (regulator of sigma subunit)